MTTPNKHPAPASRSDVTSSSRHNLSSPSSQVTAEAPKKLKSLNASSRSITNRKATSPKKKSELNQHDQHQHDLGLESFSSNTSNNSLLHQELLHSNQSSEVKSNKGGHSVKSQSVRKGHGLVHPLPLSAETMKLLVGVHGNKSPEGELQRTRNGPRATFHHGRPAEFVERSHNEKGKRQLAKAKQRHIVPGKGKRHRDRHYSTHHPATAPADHATTTTDHSKTKQTLSHPVSTPTHAKAHTGLPSYGHLHGSVSGVGPSIHGSAAHFKNLHKKSATHNKHSHADLQSLVNVHQEAHDTGHGRPSSVTKSKSKQRKKGSQKMTDAGSDRDLSITFSGKFTPDSSDTLTSKSLHPSWDSSFIDFARSYSAEDEPFLLRTKDCPTRITSENETTLVRSLLRYDGNFQTPDYGEGDFCPIGLEFLTNIETVNIVLRQMNKKRGTCYQLFTQYDIYDEEDDTLIGFGFEQTSCLTAFCCLDYRHFRIRLYDYRGKLILRAVRKCSFRACCAKYCCCCYFFGGTGCGNKLQVYDGDGNTIGYVEQAPLFARRLLALAEIGEVNVGRAAAQDYTMDEIVKSKGGAVWQEIRIRKFNAFTSNNIGFVRIEQYMENSFICKFLCLDTYEQVGYARKRGDDQIEIDLWRDYTEEEKAILIAGSFLIDHVVLGVSLEGSYYNERNVTFDESNCRIRKPMSRCYVWFCLNRCRTTIYFLIIIFIIALIVIIIIFVI